MHRLLLPLLLRATAALALAGAGPAAGQTLDFARAYEAAVVQDARLRAARHAAEAGREALPQAEAQLGPALSASVTRSKNQFISTTIDARGADTTARNGYLAGTSALTLRQPLYRPLNVANVAQARARVDESEAALARQTQSLGLQVAEAYVDVLLADEQIALVEAQRRALGTQLAAARQALAAGSGTRTDLHEVQARLALAEAELIESRQHRLDARRDLATLITDPFDAVAPLAAVPPVPPAGDAAAWRARAEAASPELRIARAQHEAAQQEVEKARAGHRPTLDLVADWSRSQNDNINRIGSRYTSKSLGLQLSVPLYNGGGVASAVRQALADVERASGQLEALRRELGARVEREHAAIAGAGARIGALEQAVRSAEQVVIANRRSFQAGSRTTVDVLNAEQQLVGARRDLARARGLHLLVQVRLAVLTGAYDAAEAQRLNHRYIAAGPAPLAPPSADRGLAAPPPDAASAPTLSRAL